MADAQPSVLIVDDDVAFANAAADFARMRGFTASVAHSLEQSRPLLHKSASDLTLLDLSLPDGSGFDLLAELDPAHQRRIALMTGDPSVETAARAVALPVLDYLLKPLPPEQFDRLLTQTSLHAQVREVAGAQGMRALVGQCKAIRELTSSLSRIAPTRASVLITGESGTGKELVASALHECSRRRGPFVAVNCGAIAPDLMASHLFGHERGSFTGAAQRHLGYFEQASGGTLFLDEITEMPAALQVYLLRALESGTITRVGGSEAIAADVRIVAATNRDPMTAIRDGALREDLFYRMADFVVSLPPLRERGQDIVLLAKVFVERFNRENDCNKRLSPGSERTLLEHAWPGNIRELRSVIQRACLLSDGESVVIPALGTRPQLCSSPHAVVFNVGMSYADIEREMLLKTLSHFGHDKTRTARALGVSVRTIHNQLARLQDDGVDGRAA